ncbi:isoprenoid biosynthesis glyoxalase ElbB [Desulfolutivibrio sulfoxidireducens]|uniref:isoprenoid biosynthesis glyoxalase ElbB n=1 Tax=Desulfolutivibrio sulfoxidireducens TaxID=2773299 RepID=UPI00159D332C|nr:isoprenoid biosynthesis glyoxalase ElbB [Desulfolutivibrio sulfoxidireducens]QLA15684.1 isoprenoid biosynthesis glyoxalase ElbB [Desulfolutivibrio sulfoxidireducens]QLA19290.1 isoprenoid biosynthesis glyoxalase ElbB [Desulfolutivibrio sulfoxidireducens]
MSTIGVILAGCGNIDGAEIHESVLTLLYLAQAGAKTRIYAPDVSFEAVNFLTKKPMGERRGVLVEAARIARSNIKDVATAKGADLDALILPGGNGVAKNLCDFAARGAGGSAHPEVARLIREVHDAGRPVGAICIAPVVLALVLGAKKPRLTIGNDMGTAQAIEKTGAVHVNCPVDDIVVDERLNLVTTPAYMLGPGIADVAKGIEKFVVEIVRRAG